MRCKTKHIAISALIATSLLAAPTITAGAHAASRVTQGDVQAVFQASGNGGWAIILNGGTSQGAPADLTDTSRVRIAPLPPFDGKSYCSLDWHVISLALIDVKGDRTLSELFEALADTDVQMTLDGEALDTQRLSPRPYLGMNDSYYVQFGRIMSPADLSVGEHTLEATITENATQDPYSSSITFRIDGADSGTCVDAENDALTFRLVQ